MSGHPRCDAIGRVRGTRTLRFAREEGGAIMNAFVENK